MYPFLTTSTLYWFATNTFTADPTWPILQPSASPSDILWTLFLFTVTLMPLLSVLMRTTQHSTAASLSSWYWKCEIEYHTDTHLTSYRIVMSCLEAWTCLEARSLNVSDISLRLKFKTLVHAYKPVSAVANWRERRNVLLLCEIWHNADSVSIRRLHAEGLSVVERARPRSREAEASVAVNHGGVAVVATAGVRLASINTGVKPSTFQCVGTRVTAGMSSYIVWALLPSLPASLQNCLMCWISCRRTLTD